VPEVIRMNRHSAYSWVDLGLWSLAALLLTPLIVGLIGTIYTSLTR
jgi:hypothetical protein